MTATKSALLSVTLLLTAIAETTDQRIAAIQKQSEVKPGDLQLKSRLATAYLQKLRETGDAGYLRRADAVVDSILETDPGFIAAKRLKAQVAMNLHEFPKVADFAQAMLAANPSDSEMLGLLGDAQMELGLYSAAGQTYRRMASLGGNLFTYNRLAYYDFVTGHPDTALAWMSQAVTAGSPDPENTAWCYTEFGDMLFKTGRPADAEQAYRKALELFPGYHRAHAGLGRVDAARNDLTAALAHYKAAQAVVPLPEYGGALEALYAQTGSTKNASAQQALMAVTEQLMTLNGETANRTLALIYADQNRDLPHALELAKAEFAVRNDVYSYDALSWVLYRLGRFDEAAQASAKALAQNTPEPNFYFHAGMIALANKDATAAKENLTKALALNPRFDPRNSALATRALQQLETNPE